LDGKYFEHNGQWCREDGNMIMRLSVFQKQWEMMKAKNCKDRKVGDQLGRAGQDVHYDGKRPVAGKMAWAKVAGVKDEISYQALPACEAYQSQTCPASRCLVSGTGCAAPSLGERVQGKKSTATEWTIGTVASVAPLMIVPEDGGADWIWDQARKLKKTLLECLAEKECWDAHFKTSAQAKACLACVDPNKPVSAECRTYRECLRTNRATLSDKSNTLLRNIKLATGQPVDVAGLLQEAESSTITGACADPSDPVGLKKITEDCGCLTSLHKKCDGSSNQQDCLMKNACADPRVCSTWKTSKCPGFLLLEENRSESGIHEQSIAAGEGQA
jgi:hypothetical protein